MPLHRLTQIVMGVPNVDQTASYYADFGLGPVPGEQAGEPGAAPGGDHAFATVDGGEQLRTGTSVRAVDPGTDVTVCVEVAARYAQDPTPAPAYNTPGVDARTGHRAPGILRDRPVRPRKLGHVVLGSTDQEFSQQFFQRGIGFKVSDTVPALWAWGPPPPPSFLAPEDLGALMTGTHQAP